MEQQNKPLTIKEWALDDRPREKMVSKGFHQAMLMMAILIGTGTTNETAVGLSQRILTKVGNNLNELGKLGLKELTDIKGIGKAKAVKIMAALNWAEGAKALKCCTKSKLHRAWM